MAGLIGTIEKTLNGGFVFCTLGGYEFPITDGIEVQGLPLTDVDAGYFAILEAWTLKVTTYRDNGNDDGMQQTCYYIRERLEKGLSISFA